MTCQKCGKINAVILLVLGIFLLLRDLSVWDFWNVQPWTLVFLVLGFAFLGCSHCKDCQVEKSK